MPDAPDHPVTDLIITADEAFSDLTAAKLVQWDPETVARFCQHIINLMGNNDETAIARAAYQIEALSEAHAIALEIPGIRARYMSRSREIVKTFLQSVPRGE